MEEQEAKQTDYTLVDIMGLALDSVPNQDGAVDRVEILAVSSDQWVIRWFKPKEKYPNSVVMSRPFST